MIERYDQNIELTDNELQAQIHEMPQVELIHTLVNPKDEHLSLALEMLWRACKPGYCSPKDEHATRAHRYAVSSITHAWFSMEAAVNLALFNLLKNPDCGYYLSHGDRKTIDRDISENFGNSYPFEKKIMYLNEKRLCCNVINDAVGNLRSFEKLRNALVHGYSFKKGILLEEQLGTKKEETDSSGKITVTTSFIIGDEEYTTPDGKPVDVMKPFKQLGITNDFTKLCRHDAYRCIRISLLVLQWLDSHYGIQTTATWDVHNEKMRFYTRSPNFLSNNVTDFKVIAGKDALIKEFCDKDEREINVAKSRKKWGASNNR